MDFSYISATTSIFIGFLSYKFYKYYHQKKPNEIKTIPLTKILHHSLIKKKNLLDLLREYKKDKVVYVWVFGWKLLILDSATFKEVFATKTNKLKLDRGDFTLNENSLLIKFMGKENLIFSKKDSYKRIITIINPYLRSEQMKKNVDVSVAESIDSWKGEINVVEKASSFSFGVICQVILGYNGMDFYEEFNDLLSTSLKLRNLLLPLHSNNDAERLSSLRNKISNKEYSGFMTDMMKERFSKSEIVDNVILLLMGGLETSTYSLSRCIYHLADIDKQRELRNSPELIKKFVKRTLSSHPPLDFTPMGNKALKDINVQGMIIPKNTHCVGIIKIMNENKEDENASFTSFSLGERACVGSTIANYELEKTISALLEKYEWKIHDQVGDNPAYPLAKRMNEFKCNFSELTSKNAAVNREAEQFAVIETNKH